jgi:hypothetical protein
MLCQLEMFLLKQSAGRLELLSSMMLGLWWTFFFPK